MNDKPGDENLDTEKKTTSGSAEIMSNYLSCHSESDVLSLSITECDCLHCFSYQTLFTGKMLLWNTV